MKKNYLKKAAATILAAALTVGFVMTSMATSYPTDASGTNDKVTKNTETTEASTYITKHLIAPNLDGTSKSKLAKALTFSYTAEAIQLLDSEAATTPNTQNNGVATDKDKDANGQTMPVADCPDIKIANIEFTKDIAATKDITVTFTDDAITAIEDSDVATDYVLYEATSVIKDKDSGDLTGSDFPHAGEYVYTITESEGADEEVKYSKASYQLHIYVANTNTAADVNGQDGLYIAAISAVRTTTNDTPYATAATEGNYVKVNTNNGGYGDNHTTGNGITFQNIYTPKSQLEITKYVKGAYADQTKFFPMEVTLNLPNTDKDNKTASYTGVVYQYDGSTWAAATEAQRKATDAASTQYPTTYTFTAVNYIATQTIYLKHNQKLWFVKTDDVTKGYIPAGTIYAITEQANKDYIPSAKISTGGVGATTKAFTDSANTATTGTSLALKTYLSGDTSTDKTIVGPVFVAQASSTADEHTAAGTLNSTEFLNTYKTVTPTGLIINNLPYIMMIVVIGAAFAIYLQAKKRRQAR